MDLVAPVHPEGRPKAKQRNERPQGILTKNVRNRTCRGISHFCCKNPAFPEVLITMTYSPVINPMMAGGFDTSGSGMGISVVHTQAYVVDWQMGLHVSTRGKPVRAGDFDTDETTRAIEISEGLAFLADEISLKIIDVSDPANPCLVTEYGSLSRIQDIQVASGFACVAVSQPSILSALLIIEAHNPSDPIGAVNHPTSGEASGLTCISHQGNPGEKCTWPGAKPTGALVTFMIYVPQAASFTKCHERLSG